MFDEGNDDEGGRLYVALFVVVKLKLNVFLDVIWEKCII